MKKTGIDLFEFYLLEGVKELTKEKKSPAIAESR
jgi:hypothetical protein